MQFLFSLEYTLTNFRLTHIYSSLIKLYLKRHKLVYVSKEFYSTTARNYGLISDRNKEDRKDQFHKKKL